MSAKPELVPGQKVFTPAQVRSMLGGIGRTTYYVICNTGLLKYSRMTPGGPRVHTQRQIDEYLAYLNQNPIAVEGQRFQRRARY